jgi:PAS domain S-box-containing protein
MLHDMIDDAAYMAHGYCLLWKPWLIATHAGSDLVIFSSYFAIPVAIWLFLRKRADLELKPLAVMFAAFIFLCGLTHIIQAATLWWPIYETQAFAKVATAAVSLTTAIAIFPLIPRAVAIPSPRQLQAVNDGLASEIGAHRRTLAELKRAKDELELRVGERTRELEHSKARFETLVRASAQIVWTCNAAGDVDRDSPSWRSFTCQSFEEFQGNGWLNAIHPDDRGSVLAGWQEAVRTKNTYSMEYRLCHASSGWRWMAAKGVPLMSSGGEVREWVGMNVDIDERRRTEEHMRFVLKELSHRTKNLLTVVYAMARQAAKQGGISNFISDFSARIQGLSRSHDLLVTSDWMGAPLEEHVRTQLAPFTAADGPQVLVSGPHLLLRPAATQALGLAFHELATNAAKYGALSRPDGVIEIKWDIENKHSGPHFKLSWRERGGAAEPQKANVAGFGTTVLSRVVPETFLGEVHYHLGEAGVVWEIEAPLGEVAFSPGAPSIGDLAPLHMQRDIEGATPAR